MALFLLFSHAPDPTMKAKWTSLWALLSAPDRQE